MRSSDTLEFKNSWKPKFPRNKSAPISIGWTFEKLTKLSGLSFNPLVQIPLKITDLYPDSAYQRLNGGTKSMQITDPVHGAIEILDAEKPIINHAAFQRLRKIGQLSNVYLAFPSGTHSRFAHSLGVMHVACRIFDVLAKDMNKRDAVSLNHIRETVRLAGLLHDLGHGPYSHQFEHVIEDKKYSELRGLKVNPNYLKNAIEKVSHEVFSFVMIDRVLKDVQHRVKPQDVCALLDENFQVSEDFKQHVTTLTSSKGSVESFIRVLRSILSSHIDADRIDYLQRDTYFTGAKIGRVDFDHLLGSISLDLDGKGEYFIKIRPNCVSTIEQILLARKAMFDQVYGQRTNVIFGDILQEILKNPLRTEVESAILRYENYIRFTDESLNQSIISRAFSKSDAEGRGLCQMFVMRYEPEPHSDIIFCNKDEIASLTGELNKAKKGSKVIQLKRVELIKGEKRSDSVFKEIRVSRLPFGDSVELQQVSPLIRSNFAEEKSFALLAVENYLDESYQNTISKEFVKTWRDAS